MNWHQQLADFLVDLGWTLIRVTAVLAAMFLILLAIYPW